MRVPRTGAAGSPQTLATGSEPVIDVNKGGRAVIAWINGASSVAPVVQAGVRSGATGNFTGNNTISFSGNGAFSVTDVDAAVGDDGSIAVIWHRLSPVPQNVVEANTRGPNGTFSANGQSISDTGPDGTVTSRPSRSTARAGSPPSGTTSTWAGSASRSGLPAVTGAAPTSPRL